MLNEKGTELNYMKKVIKQVVNQIINNGTTNACLSEDESAENEFVEPLDELAKMIYEISNLLYTVRIF